MYFFYFPYMATPVDDALRGALRDQSLTWHAIDSLLTHCRDAKPDLSVGALQTFLFVVQRLCNDSTRELTVKDVAEGLAAPYATIARQCDILCDGPKGSGGLNWLVKLPGSQPKTKSLQLTNIGHFFLKTALLNPHPQIIL